MSTDTTDWLSSNLLTPIVMREGTTPYKMRHVSRMDTGEALAAMPAGYQVCENTLRGTLADAGRDLQARERERLARAQRKAGRKRSRAARRAGRH